jgi:hypothetical protein
MSFSQFSFDLSRGFNLGIILTRPPPPVCLLALEFPSKYSNVARKCVLREKPRSSLDQWTDFTVDSLFIEAFICGYFTKILDALINYVYRCVVMYSSSSERLVDIKFIKFYVEQEVANARKI